MKRSNIKLKNVLMVVSTNLNVLHRHRKVVLLKGFKIVFDLLPQRHRCNRDFDVHEMLNPLPMPGKNSLVIFYRPRIFISGKISLVIIYFPVKYY